MSADPGHPRAPPPPAATPVPDGDPQERLVGHGETPLADGRGRACVCPPMDFPVDSLELGEYLTRHGTVRDRLGRNLGGRCLEFESSQTVRVTSTPM